MIDVIDDAVAIQQADALRGALARMVYRYGWKSQVGVDRPGHWNSLVLPADHQNTKDVSSELDGFQPPFDVFRKHWEWVHKDLFDGKAALLRYYSNTYTYGTDGYPHTDSDRDGDYTVMMYMNAEWKPEWAGATAVWDADRKFVERAVLPAPQRVIIFPGNRLHAAWAVSRICPLERTVLVMKVRDELH